LFASVPPDVKMISRGSAWRRAATRSWASSSAARVFRPKEWALDGLPNWSVRKGSIASSASRLSGVVAAWSK